MRRSILVLAAVLVLMLLFTASALAQEDTQSEIVFCGTLSDADCELLNEAQTALWGLTSGETATTVAVYLEGWERLSPDEPAVTVTTRSAFVAEQDTVDRMLALQSMYPEPLASDPDAMLEAALLPLTIDGASATIVVLSPELNTMLSDIFGRPVPAQFVHETRLVDGILYINLAQYAEFAPRVASMGDWVGIDLMAFVPNLTETSIADGNYDIADLEDALSPPGQGAMAQPYLVMIEPGTESVYDSFLEILPLRDTAIDGQVAAVYRMRMDLPAYVRSPAFSARLANLGQSVDDALEEDVPASERNIAGTIVQAVTASLLGNADAQVTQGIGYEDAYLYAMDMQLGLSIAEKAVTVNIQSGNSNMDNIGSIPVPENATVLPIRLIMGLIQTFSNGQ